MESNDFKSMAMYVFLSTLLHLPVIVFSIVVVPSIIIHIYAQSNRHIQPPWGSLLFYMK